MYLFISAWVEFDSWTQQTGHIMQCKDRLLFFSTPFRQLVESLVETHHGWRTRESQAMGRRLWENMVTVLTYFLHSHSHLNAVFPLTLPVIEKVVFFPAGRFWRRMNLAPSKPPLRRFFSNPKGKGEYVYTCKEMRHWRCFGFTAALNVSPYVLLSVFIPFSVAALPYRVLSLWHVCFSKFHRIIESYGQVRLGMVSQKNLSQTSLFSVLHLTFKKYPLSLFLKIQ